MLQWMYRTPTSTVNMLYYLVFIGFLTAIGVHSLIRTLLKPGEAKIRTPPSPPRLPLIGHLHLVGSVLAVSFQGLAKRYGPLIEMKLGASTCVVASNAAVGREIFKTQDLNFSSRPEFGSSEYFIYRGSRFVTAQYGEYWRFMKKLCMTRLLSVPQLDKFVDVHESEVARLVASVTKAAREGVPTDLSKDLTALTNNIICRMAMTTQCSATLNDAEHIRRLVKTCLDLAGKLSLGDILGPLKLLDFSGNGDKLVAALMKFDKIVERIIDEHECSSRANYNDGSTEEERKDVLDILLEIYRDPTAEVKLTKKDIKSFLLDIFMAGTDTSSSAMQWAVAELLNRPETFKKLRHEIHSVVGTARLVKDSDVPNLPYLRAVIRETLRLHPSAPLIIRECADDCVVNGCLLKSKTRVLVNVFAIMRDPEAWADPDEFVPERFLDGSDEKIGEHQMEFKGQNFRFLPFGSGRRGCPGASLAMMMMHSTVGSLVQCFDWKVKDGEEVNLEIGSGFAAEMAKPLVCYPAVHVNPQNISTHA